MDDRKVIRYAVIAVLLLATGIWMFAAGTGEAEQMDFPEAGLIASSEWLLKHGKDESVVVIDVRKKSNREMVFIEGAISMPWSLFRYHDGARGIGDVFVGYARAREILGNHGVARNDTIVIYDSVKEDGGATASYVFWVLDLLGHQHLKILERGIDGWIAAGGATSTSPRTLEPQLYQAPPGEIKLRPWKNGDFIAMRLGDPHYQVIDVRSREEYLGQNPNVGLDGNVLKLGHIPSSFHLDYRMNWNNLEEKAFLSYSELLSVYKGIDPGRAVIVYCHSGRRSSFSYFILRAMGFKDVILYEKSWNEWGRSTAFYPVETKENMPASEDLPVIGGGQRAPAGKVRTAAGEKKLEPMKGGYISCGG